VSEEDCGHSGDGRGWRCDYCRILTTKDGILARLQQIEDLEAELKEEANMLRQRFRRLRKEEERKQKLAEWKNQDAQSGG
jgi:hypothetical protein